MLGGGSLVRKHDIRARCCIFCWGPGISDVISPGFALWGSCPQRAAKVDGWMGEESTKGLTPILRGAARPQREKKIWLKKNLRGQTCWVKGVGNANH